MSRTRSTNCAFRTSRLLCSGKSPNFAFLTCSKGHSTTWHLSCKRDDVFVVEILQQSRPHCRGAPYTPMLWRRTTLAALFVVNSQLLCTENNDVTLSSLLRVSDGDSNCVVTALTVTFQGHMVSSSTLAGIVSFEFTSPQLRKDRIFFSSLRKSQVFSVQLFTTRKSPIVPVVRTSRLTVRLGMEVLLGSGLALNRWSTLVIAPSSS